MKRATALCAAAILGGVSFSLAHELQFRALLSGSNPESSGVSLITMDLDLIDMDVTTQFAGLSDNITGAEIRGRTAIGGTGTAAAAIPLPGFMTNSSSGFDQQFIDLQPDATYTPAFVNQSGGTTGAALNALVSGFTHGQMYLTLDTASSPDAVLNGFYTIWPDSNEDGTIDTPDFVEVATHFNEFGTDFHSGDFNIDGYTNALDFNAIASTFGQSISFPPSDIGTVAPEPSMLAFLLVGRFVMRRTRAKVALAHQS